MTLSVRLAGLFLLLFCVLIARADEFDVDQADGLDFQEFHRSNENSFRLRSLKDRFFGSKRHRVKKMYGDSGKGEQSPDTLSMGSISSVAGAPVDDEAFVLGDTGESSGMEHISGQRYEIRELYSPAVNQQAAVPALFAVFGALHRQMARLCPKGWEKLREWSVPEQAAYYIHYEFVCAKVVAQAD